jgi:VWFA-related protein
LHNRICGARHTVWLALLTLLIVVQPLRSQQDQPQQAQQATPTFSSNVKVVNVLATVRDKKGEIVNNLTKDDFKLEEDGRPQTIRYFAKDTDLPLTLGLLVDTSMSQRRVLEQERVASYAFLNHVMREGKDVAFVIHFDREIELLQDLTSSRQKLEAALQKLDTPEFEPANGGGGGGGGGHHGGGGGTTLYDAVFLASDEMMQKQKGRKALIILSDGVDNASKITLDRAIESAQRADTLVYSILFKDDQAYGNGGYGGPRMGGGHHGGMGGGGMGYPRGGGYPQQPSHPDGKKVLQKISQETGGRFFEVSKKEPIDQIYDQIEDELRNQYNLGFSPDQADSEGSYHKIQLTTTHKDLIVQARDGYYAEK